MNRQRDAVGLTVFDENIVAMLPASSRPGHLRSMLVTLDRLKPDNRTNVSKPLHQLADSLVKRGMVVLISDLFDDPESVINGLRHFQFRGNDVIVFRLVEARFPLRRAAASGISDQRRSDGSAVPSAPEEIGADRRYRREPAPPID
jgi:uncharacterized protein (DUF58 family)